MGADRAATACPAASRAPVPWPSDDRLALAGVIYVLRTGITWNQVPAAVIGCSGVTCWRRLRDWTEAGVWPVLQEGVPRRRMPEDRPADPGIGGEHEVPQRLGERPLTGDRLMQQLRGKPAGPGDGLAPRPLDDVPRVAEPARSVGRILSATPRPSLPHGRSARTRRPMRCPCQSRCDDRGRTAAPVGEPDRRPQCEVVSIAAGRQLRPLAGRRPDHGVGLLVGL